MVMQWRRYNRNPGEKKIVQSTQNKTYFSYQLVEKQATEVQSPDQQDIRVLCQSSFLFVKSGKIQVFTNIISEIKRQNDVILQYHFEKTDKHLI